MSESVIRADAPVESHQGSPCSGKIARGRCSRCANVAFPSIDAGSGLGIAERALIRKVPL